MIEPQHKKDSTLGAAKWAVKPAENTGHPRSINAPVLYVAHHHSGHPPRSAGAISWTVQNPPDLGKVPRHQECFRSVVPTNPELGGPANSNVLMGKLMGQLSMGVWYTSLAIWETTVFYCLLLGNLILAWSVSARLPKPTYRTSFG